MKRFYPYVDENYNAKNGEIPVYLRYNYNRVKRTFIPIHFSVRHEHWNFDKKWVKISCPEYEKINNALIDIIARLGNILTYAVNNEIDPTIDFVLMEFSKNKDYDSITKRLDLFAQLEKFIEEQKTKVVPDVIKDYKSLKKHLKGFADHSSQAITFKNLNIVFYNEFVDYLNYTAVKKDGSIGLGNNTAGKQIKNLKAFVRDRIEKKVLPYIDLTPFKRIVEEVDHIFLTEAEIQKIYNVDLSEIPEYEGIRDLFVVGCYTGLRYSDLSSLNPSHIDMDLEIIKLTQRKVHKPVTIPLIDYVPGILQKYNYSLPKIKMNEFNAGIKIIAAKAGISQPCELIRYKGKNTVKETKPKAQLVSSHTCRRSFCTNMYLAGFPAEELMKISGHKSSAAFLTYIKVDNLQAAMRLKQLRQKMAG
jgi:integrase